MESVPPGCPSGGWAYCCTPIYKTDAVSDVDHASLLREALAVYMTDPYCDDATSSTSVARRVSGPDGDRDENDDLSSALAGRQSSMSHHNAQLIVKQDLFGVVSNKYTSLRKQELRIEFESS